MVPEISDINYSFSPMDIAVASMVINVDKGSNSSRQSRIREFGKILWRINNESRCRNALMLKSLFGMSVKCGVTVVISAGLYELHFLAATRPRQECDVMQILWRGL